MMTMMMEKEEEGLPGESKTTGRRRVERTAPVNNANKTMTPHSPTASPTANRY